MKVLALDYGPARTGVAVSDPTGSVARPLEVVERASTEAGLARLVELVRVEQPARVVVGLPLTLSGELGEQARETERFLAALRQAVDVPVETY
ncbi:MAG: Holliday junction resolvase RuvX, partial [Actinomycetota bacterium]|nr:Holliday junction resolvase RuvX [Actinomycetota bacterium]